MRALRVPDCARTERARPTRDTAAHRAQSQESARRSHRQSGADGKAKKQKKDTAHRNVHTHNSMHEGSRHQYMLGGVQYVESEKQLEYMTSETHTLSSQTDTRCQIHRGGNSRQDLAATARETRSERNMIPTLSPAQGPSERRRIRAPPQQSRAPSHPLRARSPPDMRTRRITPCSVTCAVAAHVARGDCTASRRGWRV